MASGAYLSNHLTFALAPPTPRWPLPCCRYVPLLTPTSTNDRIIALAKTATSFLYCVSLTGVTGARSELPTDLNEFLLRIREQTSLPLAVGFGISTPAQVAQVSAIADGVVVGSAIVSAIDAASGGTTAAASLESFCKSMTASTAKPDGADESPSKKRKTRGSPGKTSVAPQDLSDSHFGEFGGRYIPETLVEAHRELSVAYAKAKADSKFQAEVGSPAVQRPARLPAPLKATHRDCGRWPRCASSTSEGRRRSILRNGSRRIAAGRRFG